jgi:hypothetical protein
MTQLCNTGAGKPFPISAYLFMEVALHSSPIDHDLPNTIAQDSTAMVDSRILIYAELLSNIRQISVIATLQTPCDSSTTLELSTDRKQVILHHRGYTSSLNLPGQVGLISQLQRPVQGSQVLTWRLPLAGPSFQPNSDGAQSAEAPWPASKLVEDQEFFCRSCEAVVVKKGSVKTWKDLPSENWAEMMDFWHCHKPTDHEVNGQNGHTEHSEKGSLVASKGYGASTKFMAQPGIGFVDFTSFLVSRPDCIVTEVSFIFLCPSLPTIFSLSLLSFSVFLVMGIKKAAKPGFCYLVVWPPIQIP